MRRERTVWCRHFTGLSKGRCKVGVEYRDVRQAREPGQGFAFPCIQRDGLTNCEHCDYPTEEELQAEDEAFRETGRRINKTRAAIVEHTGGKRGVRGSIPCPCCEGGTVAFSISGYNGHIHARCATEGCVQWME